MPRINLTARTIAGLRAPDPSKKQTLYWDEKLRGFGVLVSGTTNGKSFVVQRDLPGGNTRRVTIGPTNVLTLEAARKRAGTVLGDLYKGVDPKAAARERLTLRQALADYLESNKQLRDKSAADYRAGIERHLACWLDQPLRSINPQMVKDRHAAIAEEVKRDGRYKGESTANGVMRALRTLWNFAAESNPNLPTNPVRILRRSWFVVHRRDRLVRNDELPKFYGAVRALPNQIAADYLTLLLFTGLRREEAASLTWADVDLTARVIRIPGPRTKAGRKLDLPMTDYVHDLFVTRRAIGQEQFVFPSNSRAGYLAEPKFFLNQVALKTGIRVSVHDLRRTYITVAESCDISPLALKALVNHSLGRGVTEGYVQMTPERLREPAQRVTDKLKELCWIEKKRPRTKS
jgi:integrase